MLHAALLQLLCDTYVITCHILSYCVILCHLMSHSVILRHTMSYCVILKGHIQELLISNSVEDAALQCDESYQREVKVWRTITTSCTN